MSIAILATGLLVGSSLIIACEPSNEPFKAVEKCNKKICAIAFLMGLHPRLGADSLLQNLPCNLAKKICEMVFYEAPKKECDLVKPIREGIPRPTQGGWYKGIKMGLGLRYHS